MSVLPRYVLKADDLITSHKATVEGFLSQSLAKTGKASAFVEAASKFQDALEAAEVIETLDVQSNESLDQAQRIEAVVVGLLSNLSCRNGIISAAGLSQKAREHLTEKEIDFAVKRVLPTLLINSAKEFMKEIFSRYLLTEGDALGGQMRNYIGAEAGEKLTNALIDALRAIGSPAVLPSTKLFDVGTEESHFTLTKSETQKILRVSWENKLLLFDVKPALIGKNIDVILLNTSSVARPTGRATKRNSTGKPSKAAETTYERALLSEPSNYLACGELKGGIDPAGADEHWKTARSALDRIRERFQPLKHCPALFFVGAAIQADMAEEIFTRLQNGCLTYGANLTVPEQVQDLAEWLVAL